MLWRSLSRCGPIAGCEHAIFEPHAAALQAELVGAARACGKWLTLAFVLESLMIAYIPNNLIASIAGDGSVLSILAATLVGIPSYLNGNAALPLVAGLMEKGMAPGAVMAFLVVGGVTSIPAALAVWAIARRMVFAAYLAFATASALLSGIVFQVFAG